MSKKHFEAFAEKINAGRKLALHLATTNHNLCDMLLRQAEVEEALVIAVASQFNPKFDATRFAAACRKGAE